MSVARQAESSQGKQPWHGEPAQRGADAVIEDLDFTQTCASSSIFFTKLDRAIAQLFL
jgi:hypothetical protein